MTNDSLSPAARAVLEVYRQPYIYRNLYAAAALRELADQVVPDEDSCEGGFSDSLEHQYRASERKLVRAEILAIAAELEGSN